MMGLHFWAGISSGSFYLFIYLFISRVVIGGGLLSVAFLVFKMLISELPLSPLSGFRDVIFFVKYPFQ